MNIKAPWPDFKGNDIYEGDTIKHPSGQQGVVVFRPERESDTDRWLVSYFEGGLESRLCLQIGDRGMAEVLTPEPHE